VDATVPEELDELLQRLTARTPSDRPESSGDIRDTLRKLAVAPDTSGALQRLSQGVVWVRAQTVTAEHAFRALPRPQQKRAALAGGALIALISLALLWPSKSSKPLAAKGQGAQGVAQEEDQDEDQDEDQEDKPAPEVPDELAGNLDALLNGKTLRERRDAGQALLSYGAQDRIAAPIKRLAELEVATGCKARRTAIDAMLAEPDPRFLAPLRRRHEAPRSGCGFLDLSDCYSCNRTDFKNAVEQLDKLFPPTAAP
jgi:hypothetical protein